MKLHLLRIGDGRDEIHERSNASLMKALPGFDSEFVVDDSDHELGFAGAIQHGWENVPRDADWVFHAELDFLYRAEIPIDRMITVLSKHPYLVQMALKRQPVNEQEVIAGGIVECRPDDFEQRTEGGNIWTEHRCFVTTNPSVYPAALCRQGWPQIPESEGHFGLRLFADPKARSAFWGAKFDEPLVEHIGKREGTGY